MTNQPENSTHSKVGVHDEFHVADAFLMPGPHTGKGPRGFRSGDEQIVDEAEHRLTRHGHVDATRIEVSSANGVVTLRGTVDDDSARREAEACVASTYGVREVRSELEVASSTDSSK
ncbi:MAG: BON domain-containing protein [Planctomycetes bacterium]|nr:BON domain-containing protein [Planctomycetota bacterium]